MKDKVRLTVDREQVASSAIGQTFTKQWKYMFAPPCCKLAWSLRKANWLNFQLELVGQKQTITENVQHGVSVVLCRLLSSSLYLSLVQPNSDTLGKSHRKIQTPRWFLVGKTNCITNIDIRSSVGVCEPITTCACLVTSCKDRPTCPAFC